MAFATILAVVAGLTLSGASAVSRPLRDGDQSTEGRQRQRTPHLADHHDLPGIVAVVLGIAFQKQNIAFMVSLAFAVAASPTSGAVLVDPLEGLHDRAPSSSGLISSVVRTVAFALGLGKQRSVTRSDRRLPYTSPALFPDDARFLLMIWIVTEARTTASGQIDRAGVSRPGVRSGAGIGAASLGPLTGVRAMSEPGPALFPLDPPGRRVDPASRERRESVC